MNFKWTKPVIVQQGHDDSDSESMISLDSSENKSVGGSSLKGAIKSPALNKPKPNRTMQIRMDLFENTSPVKKVIKRTNSLTDMTKENFSQSNTQDQIIS